MSPGDCSGGFSDGAFSRVNTVPKMAPKVPIHILPVMTFPKRVPGGEGGKVSVRARVRARVRGRT